jgi:dTDP-glucose 4,6-dehydratase
VSTDEVYGSIEQGSFSEDDSFRPSSPYAASKAGAELLAAAYAHTFDYPILITRGSNTYGPHQYPEKMIPLFIANAIDDQPLPLYGDGMNVRDWLYVEDHCRGIDLVLREGKRGEAYNVGADQERTNLEVTRQVLALLGKGEELIKFVADRPGHDRRYSLNSAKSTGLGWRQRVEFEQGLERTVAWYRANEAWWRRLKDESYREYYRKMYGNR